MGMVRGGSVSNPIHQRGSAGDILREPDRSRLLRETCWRESRPLGYREYPGQGRQIQLAGKEHGGTHQPYSIQNQYKGVPAGIHEHPLSEGDTFKEMVWGKCPPLSKLQFVVAYGDPAPSNSKNKATSFKACFLIGYYDGKFYVYTGYLDHVVNEEYVNWYYYLREYVGQKRRYIITSRTTSCRILSTNRYSYLCLTKRKEPRIYRDHTGHPEQTGKV